MRSTQSGLSSSGRARLRSSATLSLACAMVPRMLALLDWSHKKAKPGAAGHSTQFCWAVRLNPGEAGLDGLVPRPYLQPPSAFSQGSTTRQLLSCWTAGGSSWSSGELGCAGQWCLGAGMLQHFRVIDGAPKLNEVSRILKGTGRSRIYISFGIAV